jgi:2-hydroxyacylsphingosine 1-beta-galactosyltransferase
MNLPNVMLKKFVPQIELLNDDRVVAFVSHCGGNSIVESLYYGKVLIGHPISGDQVGAAYRVERMGLGISLRKNPSVERILESMQSILNENEGISKY